MHLTAKLLPGLPSLRRRGALAELRRLRDRAAGRARVFADGFWSSSGRSVRQAFQMVASDRRWDHPAALELAWGQSCRRRNGPSDGRRRTRPCPGQTGSALGLDLPLLSADRFLRSVFGPRGPDRDALLVRMLTERVPFVPLAVRRQATLPGMA